MFKIPEEKTKFILLQDIITIPFTFHKILKTFPRPILPVIARDVFRQS